MARPPANGLKRPSLKRIEPPAGFAQKLAYVVWFQLLCDPQWLLATKFRISPAVKLPLVLVGTLALVTLFTPKKADWLWPMGAWIFVTAVNLPSSDNLGASLVPFDQLIVYYVLGLGLVRAIRTPRAAGPILFMLCISQYFWWGGFGVWKGDVSWHPDFANFDGYGPLMASGVGPAYYYATATTSPRAKKLALFAASLCVLGVVSSFARGAFVSLVATMGYIWLRSPRKGQTLGFLMVAGLVGAIGASLISGTTRGDDTQSNFWDEMGTIFNSGGTREDRAVLRDAATAVFFHDPVFGAGAGNFGPVAAKIIQVGGVGGAYGDNPGRLAQRSLHNIYFQLLAEYGLVGTAIFAYMLVQFWRNSLFLRREEASAAWFAAGGREDVGKITLGIEAGMIAFLVNGYFYNMLFYAILYAFLFANILIRTIVDRQLASDVAKRGQPQSPARRLAPAPI